MTKHFGPLRGIQSVRADAGGVEAVAIANRIAAAFEEFKAANDARLKAVETGKADALLDKRVDDISASISTLQGQLADVAAKAAGRGLGAGDSDAAAKAAEQFSREIGQQVDASGLASYGLALNAYLRRGDAAPAAVRAELNVGSDPDGGYTVTPDMSGRIIKRVYETSPMRQVASVVTIGTDALEGFNDLGEVGSGWVGERQARTETTTAQLGKWSIPVNELYAMPKVTQKLLDDSMFDIEGWLAEKVADKLARTENTAFMVGDGELKPRGLFSYPTAATADAARAWGTFEHVATGAAGALGSADKLVDTVFKLKAAYRQNASWMMARAMVAEVRKLKDGQGNYLWQPDFGQRQGGTLAGYPIVEAEDVPAAANNSLSLAFGDFREAYTIVDRVGIRVLRDPFTQKGFILFYTTKRVGGGALNFDAVKFIKLS